MCRTGRITSFSIRVFYLFLTIILQPAIKVHSQYFSLGQEPASIKWSQIRTDNFRIIYPESFSEKALYLANSFEYSHGAISKSLMTTPRNIPVILHPNSTYSNAYVPYAPRRIEFHTVPPQDSYPQDWLDQLVLHEYRHVVQYSKIRNGFTKVLSYIFGEQAIPAIYGIFVPFWFIEGDATITETDLSASGRGRLPSFEMKLKAQFLDRKVYNYDKALHGSFKDFTPDVYELGYHLMSQVRRSYKKNIWASVLDRVARRPYTLVPFSHGIYKETGKGKVKLYKELTIDLREAWTSKDENVEEWPFRIVSPSKKMFTQYFNPVFLNDSVIVVHKEPYNDIPRLYTIDLHTSRESRLMTPGVWFFKETLSYDGKELCWSERIPDPRWQLKDHAIIRLYNIEKGLSRQVTNRSRYFAPSLSPDGTEIAAVHVSTENKYSLVILDTEGGDVKQSFTFPDNRMILTPCWSADGNKIVVVVIGGNGKALVIYYPENDTYRMLSEMQPVEISYPIFYEKYVIYSAAYSGIDNIYALDTITGEILQVTSVRYGAYGPNTSPDGSMLVFMNYTSDGHEVAIANLEPEKWQPVNPDRRNSLNLYKDLDEGTDFIFDKSDIPDSNYVSQPYKKGRSLFNFHSWGPLSIDVDNQDVKPGIQVMSQNLLSSSFTSLGWEYDMNEETGKFYLKYRYEGIYPTISFEADYGKRKIPARLNNGESITVKWNELNLGTTAAIPFDFSKNRYFRRFQPSFGITYTHRDLIGDQPVMLRYNNLVSFTYRIYYSQQTRMNHRDIFPRFGQFIDFLYRHDPFNTSGGDNPASIGALVGGVFLPGIVRNHGIRLYGGYQARNETGSIYSNLISLPRGMSDIPPSPQMLTAKFDYVLPIFYPDWRIGPVVYIKRFKSRLFVDYLYWELKDYHSNSYPDGTIEHDYSFGIDLTMDFHLFSLLAPFEIGVRGVVVMGPVDTQEQLLQFLFSFNIGSIY